jgi:hypothetical protein
MIDCSTTTTIAKKGENLELCGNNIAAVVRTKE